MLKSDIPELAVQKFQNRKHKENKKKPVLDIYGANCIKSGSRESGFTLLEIVLALALLAVFSTLFFRTVVVNWQIIQKCETKGLLLQEAVNRMEQLQAAERIDVDLISELEDSFNIKNREYQSKIETSPVHEGLLEVSVFLYPLTKNDAPEVNLVTCISEKDLSPGGSKNEQ